MRIGISIQARLNSKRLPRKVLLPIQGKSLLENIYERMLGCYEADVVYVASGTPELSNLGLRSYCGEEDNLMARHYTAARVFEADAICRITADCLFHDPALIDEAIESFRYTWPRVKALSNWHPHRTWSEGVDFEIYSMDFLRRLEDVAGCPRETFATYCAEQGLFASWEGDYNDGDLKLSIDTASDYERAKFIMDAIGGRTSYDLTREAALRYDSLHQG